MTTVKTPGRPRDAAIDEAILRTAWEQLNRVGYAALTMTAVADGAGLHTPALYRRWPTKPLLVIDTLAVHLPELTSTDCGSLRADLEHVLSQLARAWRTPAARWSFSPLFADVARDAETLAAFRKRLLDPRALALATVLDRATRRGELAAHVPLHTIAHLIEGPLMHEAMFGSGQLADDLIEDILIGCLTVLQGGRPAGVGGSS